jgi:cell division transport system permease protein
MAPWSLGVLVSKTGRTVTQSAAKVSLTRRFAIWRLHHRLARRDTVARLGRYWVSTLLTVLVMSVVLSLPAALSMGVLTLEAALAEVDRGDSITVMTHDSVSLEQASALSQELGLLALVKSVSLVSKEQALDELSQWLGLSPDVLASLGNPLPHSISLTLTSTQTEALQALTERLNANPLVADVLMDMEWLSRLQSIALFGERLMWAFVAIALLACLLIIGNTIRLAVESRRQEILVTKLVGANNAYVMRPFLYTGFAYGAAGGLVALLITYSVKYWLGGPIEALASSYQAPYFELRFPPTLAFALLATAIVLGMLGAWASAGRQLKLIEPR